MTRELKLALILGSSLVLVVGVLISDHLSGARDARIARVDPPLVAAPVEQMPPLTAGRPRSEPQLASSVDPVVVPPMDSSFDAPRTALGDPMPNGGAEIAAAPGGGFAPFTDWARQQGVTLKPMDEFAAVETDQVDAPLEIVMGQPVKPADTLDTRNNGGLSAPTTSAPATTDYMVQAGDTLWTLAARHLGAGTRHEELKALNKDRLGPNGELRVGTKIRVPASGGESRTAEKKAAPSKQATPPATAKTYTVKRGDTLRKIAAKTLGSEGRWKDLVESNKSVIKDPDALRVGAVLKIPSK